MTTRVLIMIMRRNGVNRINSIIKSLLISLILFFAPVYGLSATVGEPVRTPDAVYAKWLGSHLTFLKLDYRPLLGDWIWYYEERLEKSTERALQRLRPYEWDFKVIFRHYGIPEELVYLCIVESASKSYVESPTGAAGLWQLMPETAAELGLEVGYAEDERYDPYLSCEAAAKYLLDAYDRLGSWALAICAYNCGTVRVAKAMTKEKSEDVWSILPHLPKETQAYLPRYVAVMWLVNFVVDNASLSDQEFSHANNEVQDVAEGRYDWRIERDGNVVSL